MNQTALRAEPASAPSLGQIWRLFLPLSVSDIMTVISGPILTGGLARLPHTTTNLAAYAVAESVAIVIEAPIIMLLNAATALGRSPRAYRALRTFMILANLLLTVVHGLVAFTPWYNTVFAGWLHQPAEVVAAARPAFQVMLLWTAAIGWRRFYQGLLITYRQSTLVFTAALGRLAGIAATVLIGVKLKLSGALVAGLALQVSVTVECILIHIFSRPYERMLLNSPEPPATPGLPQTLPAVTVWYLPLALTAIMAWLARPFINGAMALAPLASISLAAWPIAWTTISLIASSTRMIQQCAITLVHDRASYLALRRFGVVLSLISGGLVLVLTFSPLAGAYVSTVIGVHGELAAVSLSALQVASLFPLFVTWQNFYQGLLIKQGKTRSVNAAAIGGSIVLVVALFAGVYFTSLTGARIGATATQVGIIAELAVLWFATRKTRAALMAAG